MGKVFKGGDTRGIDAGPVDLTCNSAEVVPTVGSCSDLGEADSGIESVNAQGSPASDMALFTR